MKKILMFALAAVTLSTAKVNAQTEKGDWMVGGNLKLSTTKNNTNFTLAPTAGYFFARNFAAGAYIDLSTGKTGDVKSSTLGVGPFARYYFDLKQDYLKPFVHVGVDFATYKTKNKATNIDITTHGTDLDLAAGLAYFVTTNVALEGRLGYQGSKTKGSDFHGGLAFNVGFQIHLTGGQIKSASRK